MVDERGPDVRLAIIVVVVVVVDSLDLRKIRTRVVASFRWFVVIVGFSRHVSSLLPESSVSPFVAVSVTPPVVPPWVVTALEVTASSPSAS